MDLRLTVMSNVLCCIVPDQMFTSCKPNSLIFQPIPFNCNPSNCSPAVRQFNFLSGAQNLHTGSAVFPGGIQDFFLCIPRLVFKAIDLKISLS